MIVVGIFYSTSRLVVIVFQKGTRFNFQFFLFT